MQKASLLLSKPPVVDRCGKDCGKKGPKAIVLSYGGLIYPLARS